MMKRIYNLIRSCITVLAAFAVLHGNAQNLTVTGKVTSEDDADEGLPGVTVLVSGTTNGTVTDFNGEYRLSVSPDDVLTYSFVGYKAQEVNVNGRSVINVSLEYDQKTLDEVVVVGYGEQNRRDLTGSVVSIKSDELSQATPTSALEGMRGRLSGVSITANGGPGESPDILIRGVSTLNGGTGPLYVVDGQQMDDIDNINPDDIASVEVLKDGASAAIYGSRSVNGVIIVTTKKGKAGETQINASYVRSYTALATKIPVSNTSQARIYEIARRGNDAVNPGPPADSLDAQFNQDFDYQEQITRIGIRDQIGLSLSGGQEDAKFYWNTGYMNQEGVVKNSDFQRINSTLNINFKVADWINAGTRVLAIYSERNGLSEGSVFNQLSTHFPYLPTQDADGTYVPRTSSQENVLANAVLRVNKRSDYDGQVFNYLEFELLPSLKFKSTLGVELKLRRDNEFVPTIVQRIGQPAQGEETTRVNFALQQENYLSFKKKFGDHNVSAVVGMQLQRWRNEFSRLRSINFNNDNIQTFNNVADYDLSRTLTRAEQRALVSQFGRVTYDYKGKYLFGATIRNDGSSRFGSANRYGLFPGASLGWRISDEFFWEPLSSVVSDFKVRVGISKNGNENLNQNDFYPSLTLYGPGFFYDGVNGISVNQLGNIDLQWEETVQRYIGVDLGFFGGRITATADYYEKETSELLYLVPLAEENGLDEIADNIGSIKNRGVEVTVSGDIITGADFTWYSSFNISTNANEVVDIAEQDGQIIDGNYLISEGGSIGDFYGYTVEGVFAYDESNAFDDDGNQLTPIFEEDVFVRYELEGLEYTGNINKLQVGSQVLRGGDVIWKDHNGDFNIDAGNDRSVIGNAFPEFFGGFYNEFTYKGVKLSVLFDYNFGNDIYRDYDETRNQRLRRTVLAGPDRIDQAWYQQGDVSLYPTLNGGRAAVNGLGPNTYWMSDADFIKLRSLRVDYSLPSSVMDKIGFLSDVSLYVSGNNLLTWTNYVGYNPELGSRGNPRRPGTDNLRYPFSREYILGLNVKF